MTLPRILTTMETHTTVEALRCKSLVDLDSLWTTCMERKALWKVIGETETLRVTVHILLSSHRYRPEGHTWPSPSLGQCPSLGRERTISMSSVGGRSKRNCFLYNSPFYSFKKYYLFNVYEYIVAVFRNTRRGHQTPLQMVVSHHVVAGISTQDLWKSSWCS